MNVKRRANGCERLVSRGCSARTAHDRRDTTALRIEAANQCRLELQQRLTHAEYERKVSELCGRVQELARPELLQALRQKP